MNNNENNENNQNQNIINIPGVIIPPQKTENGVVISSTVDDTKETIGVENISTSNDVTTQTPVSAPVQTTQMPQQTQEAANSVTNVNNPASLIPNGNLAPTDPTQTANKINAYASTNSTPQPINTQLPINDASLPKVETTELDKKGRPIKKKKDKKKKSAGTIVVNSGLVGVIVLLLMGLGYFVYNDYFKPKPKVDPVKEYSRKRTYNINSYIVKELFDFVNLKGCGDQINFFYSGDNIKIKASDLTQENKNYLAYRMLKYSSFEKKNCTTYENAMHASNPLGLWYCGNYDETGKEDETTVFSEADLKDEVERMFGDGSYKAVSFATNASARYMYNEKNENYVYQSFSGDNSCTPHTNTLTDAYGEGDNVTIVVKVINNENKNETLFYYTFTESDDGNYYFNNLTKKRL